MKCTRGVPKVSTLIYKDTQYNSHQLIFVHNLCELQYTYSIVSAASVFQSCIRVFLAPKGSPPSVSVMLLSLENCVPCKYSFSNGNKSANRNQRVLDLANMVDVVIIHSKIQPQQRWQHHGITEV